MTALKSALDSHSDTYTAAAEAAESRLEEIGAELAKALGGGGAKYVDRHHERDGRVQRVGNLLGAGQPG